METKKILILIIVILSFALLATKIIAFEKKERIWKCETHVVPYGAYDKRIENTEGKKIYAQSSFIQEQKCYFNY
ncbi:MAG: hypothetical protein AABY22_26570 [Nanoarchaeota archaeon]